MVDERMQDRGPEARRARWRTAAFWRDAWMVIVSAAILWVLFISLPSYLHRLQDSRVESALSNCRLNTAQDDVLRALLNFSLKEQARRFPDRDPFGRTVQQRAEQAQQIMGPLGGIALDQKSQLARDRLCVMRAESLRVP